MSSANLGSGHRVVSRLPTLRHRTRRRPLTILLVAGLARGGLAFATVLLFAALSRGQIPAATFAAALLGTALGLGLLRALETVQAERLGQAYVHSLRKRLLRTLDERGREGRLRFGRGSLWLRLTSDLNGLRRWISQGLARSVAAAAMLGSLTAALLVTHPPLAMLIGAVFTLFAGGLLWQRRALNQAERELRRKRSRLANGVERCMARSIESRCAEEERGVIESDLRKAGLRSAQVAQASVARSAIHAQVRALSEFAPLAAISVTVALAGSTAQAALLPALALVGLLAQPLRDLGLAWEMRQSYRVAAAKVESLLQAEDSASSVESTGSIHQAVASRRPRVTPITTTLERLHS